MAKIKIIQNTSRITKDGLAPLYISFYLERSKLMLPCKISVPVIKFDSDKGSIKGTSKEAKDTNLILTNMISRVNDILVKFRLRNISLNKESFMREYNNPSDYNSFHDFVKDYMRSYSRKIEYSTLQHHRSCLKKFQEYKADIQFHEITEDLIQDYHYYMKRKLGNSEITAQRNLATIKIYVGAAAKKGYIQNNPFKEIKIKKVKNTVDYLTEDELATFFKIYSERTIAPKLYHTIEFFLFMCLTSLHISYAVNF